MPKRPSSSATRNPPGLRMGADAVTMDNSTGFLVRRAYRAFTRALELRLTEHDVSISMWFFLRLLWLQDGVTQKELSAELGLSQPTTVAAIDNLEQRGFVERRRNVADRRKINVYLTSAGRNLEAVLVPYARAVNQVAEASLPAADRELARNLLIKMIDSLNTDIAAWSTSARGRPDR